MCKKAMLVLCNCFDLRQTVFWQVMVSSLLLKFFIAFIISYYSLKIGFMNNSDMQAKHKAGL